jgi:hypothetical protein
VRDACSRFANPGLVEVVGERLVVKLRLMLYIVREPDGLTPPSEPQLCVAELHLTGDIACSKITPCLYIVEAVDGVVEESQQSEYANGESRWFSHVGDAIAARGSVL